MSTMRRHEYVRHKPKLLSLRSLYAVLFLLLLACYALMSARILDPFSGAIDLGRHLRDGESLLSSEAWQVLHTNFYSYTYPAAPFVDHHWLASLLFFLVWKCVGFTGLNVFYIALGTATFLIFFRIAQVAAGFPLSLALALFLMPILRARASIRPEIFTFLLCGVFLWLLLREYHSAGSPGWKRLLLFAGLQALWVNVHSGFVFGPLFVGVFLLSDKLLRIQRWSIILLVTLVACLVNPSGIRGALYPYALLSTKTFPTEENLSVSELQSLRAPVELTTVYFALFLLGVSFAVAVWKRRFVLPLFVLSAVVGILTWQMYRNHPLLGFLSLAITAINVGVVRHRLIVLAVLCPAMVAGFCFNAARLIKEKDSMGLGLKPGRDAAAEFFQTNHLQGPILNNFNIGGYLIYYLFPKDRVYIDSRPEAYPNEFLENGYLLPLRGEEEWERLLSAYQFNAIVFCWGVDWEEEFVGRRMLDPAWAVVFLDRGAVILLRRTPQNQNVLSRFEIPRERLPLVRR